MQILDCRNLHIKQVVNDADQADLDYAIDEPVHPFGSKLSIWLPKVGSKKYIFATISCGITILL